MMSVQTRPLTYEDLCRAREDGNRYELIEGELIVIAGPSPKHQWALHWLTVAFHRAVVEPGLGFVFTAPLDVRLEGRSYVQPDLLVVLNERAGIIGPTMIEDAPDLIVEITSTSSRTLDRTRKLALYARAGVREYWLLESRARRLSVHADPAGDRFATVVPAGSGESARSIIVPSLAVEVDGLFRGLPDRT
jgi:Uma2 family endonuclease